LRLFQKSFCKALRLTIVRIFSEPPGDYGTRIDKAIAMSNTWEKEEEIARLYINRMSISTDRAFGVALRLYPELKLPYIAEERIYSPPLIMMIIFSI
jgi:hypothetical protein